MFPARARLLSIGASSRASRTKKLEFKIIKNESFLPNVDRRLFSAYLCQSWSTVSMTCDRLSFTTLTPSVSKWSTFSRCFWFHSSLIPTQYDNRASTSSAYLSGNSSGVIDSFDSSTLFCRLLDKLSIDWSEAFSFQIKGTPCTTK